MISKTEIQELRGGIARWKDRHQSALKKGEHVVKTFVRTGTIATTAFLLGAVEGHQGKEVKIAGAPLNLGVAVLATVGNHLGFAGKHSHHLQAIGDGAAALAAASAGLKVGMNWKKGEHAAQGDRSLPRQPRGNALNDREASGYPSGNQAVADAALAAQARNA